MSKNRRKPSASHPAGDDQGPEIQHRDERLQKVLAAAGVASRRECEELIVTGRVEVDRRIVTELGTKVDPSRQDIRVDGVALPKPKLVHYLLNKPPGVVCTNYDPSGRVRVIDLINTDERIFPVGRLDRASEGLILVTNDGTLANRLTHPRFGVEKTYLVMVHGHPALGTIEKLRQGVYLAEGMARVADISVKRRHPTTTEMVIVLKEGRNREIRRILARVGHKVLRLKRIAIGPIKIEMLGVGAYRKLTYPEVQALEKSVSRARAAAKKASRMRRAEGGGKSPGRRPAGEGKPSFSDSAAPRPQSTRPNDARSIQPAARKPTQQKPPEIPFAARQDDEDDDDDFEEFDDGHDDDDDDAGFSSISPADFESDFSGGYGDYDAPLQQGAVLGAEDDGFDESEESSGDVGPFADDPGARKRKNRPRPRGARAARPSGKKSGAARSEGTTEGRPGGGRAGVGRSGGRSRGRVGGRATFGKSADGRPAEGHSAEARPARPAGKKPFGKKPVGKKPVGKKPVGKKPFGKRKPGGQSSGGQSSGGRPAEGRGEQGKKNWKPKRRGR